MFSYIEDTSITALSQQDSVLFYWHVGEGEMDRIWFSESGLQCLPLLGLDHHHHFLHLKGYLGLMKLHTSRFSACILEENLSTRRLNQTSVAAVSNDLQMKWSCLHRKGDGNQILILKDWSVKY